MRRFKSIVTSLGITAAFAASLAAQVIDAPIGQQPGDMRVLAGLAGYPAEIVDALASISGNADLLRIVADRTARGERPNFDESSSLPAAQREALRRLSDYPDLIAVAAADPELTQRLATAWHASPSEFRDRLLRVQQQSASLETAAIRGWQFLLENDPVAMGDYRDWLTRFCTEQQKAEPRYAVVRVTDRRYYYAAAPTEEFRRFLAERNAPASLRRTIDRWEELFGPAARLERLDRMQDGRAEMPRRVGEAAIDLSAAERRAMWRADGTAEDARPALGLMPVIMQPVDDMPAEARVYRAVEQHAALWHGATMTDAPTAGGDPVVRADGAAQSADEAAAARREIALSQTPDRAVAGFPAISLDENAANVQQQLDAQRAGLDEPIVYRHITDDSYRVYSPGYVAGGYYGTTYPWWRYSYDPYGHVAYPCDSPFNPYSPECLVGSPVTWYFGRPGFVGGMTYGGRCDDDRRRVGGVRVDRRDGDQRPTVYVRPQRTDRSASPDKAGPRVNTRGDTDRTPRAGGTGDDRRGIRNFIQGARDNSRTDRAAPPRVGGGNTGTRPVMNRPSNPARPAGAASNRPIGNQPQNRPPGQSAKPSKN